MNQLGKLYLIKTEALADIRSAIASGQTDEEVLQIIKDILKRETEEIQNA